MDRLLHIATTVLLLAHLAAPGSAAPLEDISGIPATDVALYAADSVQIPVPPGWQTLEVPYGREVRLVLLPPGVTWTPTTPDAAWICHHIMPMSDSEQAATAELADFNQRRVRAAVGMQGTFSEPAQARLSDWPAIAQEFVVTAPPQERRGHHLSSRTPWGVVEVHFGTTAADYADRVEAYELMMQGLRVQPPRRDERPPVEHVRDAAPILGSWKAYRSRLQLSPDGQVRIMIDPINLHSIDTSPSSQILSGEYSAQDDLLYIRWSDGSLLNYRWRMHGQELLLTDHLGQPSRLKRLLD